MQKALCVGGRSDGQVVQLGFDVIRMPAGEPESGVVAKNDCVTCGAVIRPQEYTLKTFRIKFTNYHLYILKGLSFEQAFEMVMRSYSVMEGKK